MTPDMIDALIQNISFGALFVALFVWTLRANEKRELANEKREQRYLSLLDNYGKQMESIANTLKEIQNQVEALRK